MNPTPNTPAIAGNDAFAREAADRLLTEQWPVMSMFLTQEACIAARENFVREIIQQAIERDRAEREAELRTAYTDAKQYAKEAGDLAAKLNEREAELAELAESQRTTIAFLSDAEDELRKLQAKLAEQSAERLRMLSALACVQSILKEGLEHQPVEYDVKSLLRSSSITIESMKQALAQIEALAGGKGSNE